jgi:hypothetical protein
MNLLGGTSDDAQANQHHYDQAAFHKPIKE